MKGAVAASSLLRGQLGVLSAAAQTWHPARGGGQKAGNRSRGQHSAGAPTAGLSFHVLVPRVQQADSEQHAHASPAHTLGKPSSRVGRRGNIHNTNCSAKPPSTNQVRPGEPSCLHLLSHFQTLPPPSPGQTVARKKPEVSPAHPVPLKMPGSSSLQSTGEAALTSGHLAGKWR